MFSKETISLLVQVIFSWQVIAVTIAVFLYISLVNFVARTHISKFRYSSPIKARHKQKKAVQAAKASSKEKAEDDVNDELGLEEE